MKRTTLLLLVMACFITSSHSQKKQTKNATGFAITAQEKGGRSWKEVRLVNMNTGEPIKNIYESKQDLEALNARTGKPVQKKTEAASKVAIKKIVNLDMELDKVREHAKTQELHEQRIVRALRSDGSSLEKKIIMVRGGRAEVQTDKPFATNSAAMAYDKKHERLYYTPMGINQLRYIDMKSKTPKVYFFEDEPFGKVSGLHDAPNQITRMVIASDGNGYALSNDANHLIRFTTGKKPAITDLGALQDEAGNTTSVHSRSGYGGDMIADAAKNLYLITANRNVFKINIESLQASFKGTIKGLPKGFSTNGAMVEEGSKVIVASSESTAGYFRFDLNTLQAEKISAEGAVFNASDLANGVLAFAKKKKKDQPEEKEEPVEAVVTEEAAKETTPENILATGSIGLYPNPVNNGLVKLSFNDQPAGKYQVQLLDLAGRLVRSQEVNIQNKVQVIDFPLPDVARGSYLVKIASEANNISIVNKLVVQ